MNGTDVVGDVPLIVAFPLPFQILALVGLAVLGWAINLHGLDLAGIDVISSLDLRADTHNALPSVAKQTTSLAMLYRSVYRIFTVYSMLCFGAWLAYRFATHGDIGLVDVFGYIPALAALSVICILLSPYNILHKTERRKFLHATLRCLIPSEREPIYFSDVILADIFTSFAQVIGDVWLSLCMLIPGHSILSPSAGVGMSRWVLPTLMSFPHLLRLRQCIIENNHQGNTSRRPLYNALKYATAFPVIYLSAAQGGVLDAGDDNIVGNAWHGQNQVFRVWLLAALVNSLYSFWWDVTNDWGFNLLKLRFPWTLYSSAGRPHLHSNTPLASKRSSFDGDALPDDTPQPITGRPHYRKHDHRYGLRSTLHFPFFVYPLLIILNLALRLMWSMKLFSVHNVKSHVGITDFGLKMAELFRRWMWVFVRVEWEIIRKGREGYEKSQIGGDDEEYELISSGGI